LAAARYFPKHLLCLAESVEDSLGKIEKIFRAENFKSGTPQQLASFSGRKKFRIDIDRTSLYDGSGDRIPGIVLHDAGVPGDL